MKTYMKKLLLLLALIAGFSLILGSRLAAQTFTVLHSFIAVSDGASPYAGLITNLLGNTLYGTTGYGGSSGQGTVFKVNMDGTGFTNLHSFTTGSGCLSNHYQQRWSQSACRTDFVGQYPVWDSTHRRQFGRRHGLRDQHRWNRFCDPA